MEQYDKVIASGETGRLPVRRLYRLQDMRWKRMYKSVLRRLFYHRNLFSRTIYQVYGWFPVRKPSWDIILHLLQSHSPVTESTPPINGVIADSSWSRLPTYCRRFIVQSLGKNFWAKFPTPNPSQIIFRWSDTRRSITEPGWSKGAANQFSRSNQRVRVLSAVGPTVPMPPLPTYTV